MLVEPDVLFEESKKYGFTYNDFYKVADILTSRPEIMEQLNCTKQKAYYRLDHFHKILVISGAPLDIVNTSPDHYSDAFKTIKYLSS